MVKKRIEHGRGWLCPVCGASLSPYMSFCPLCTRLQGEGTRKGDMAKADAEKEAPFRLTQEILEEYLNGGEGENDAGYGK